tara:strand:- start:149 stop:292 length:144 start_codon:yes stop_codon:yes gene_type:complete
MYSLSIEYPEDMYVESETPQDQQKYKGWYWDSGTKKFYRWDNSPRSE